MTTFDDYSELDELDEIASAIIDGEATAEEQARLETDPELRARVAEFMLVAEAVAVPVTPPSDQDRDQAIAAALAQSPVATTAPVSQQRTEPNVTGTVHSLDQQRSKRQRRFESAPRILQAVAALAVIGIGGIGLWGLSQGSLGSSEETAATSADIQTEVAESGADASDEEPAFGASMSEPLAVPVPNFQTDASNEDSDALGDAVDSDFASEAMAESAAPLDSLSQDSGEAMAAEAEEASMEEANEATIEEAVTEAASDSADTAGASSADMAFEGPQAKRLSDETIWFFGYRSPDESFENRNDSVGVFTSAEELTQIDLDDLPPEVFELAGSQCAEVLSEIETGNAVVLATAVVTEPDQTIEVIIVEHGGEELRAYDRATCEILVTWTR